MHYMVLLDIFMQRKMLILQEVSCLAKVKCIYAPTCEYKWMDW